MRIPKAQELNPSSFSPLEAEVKDPPRNKATSVRVRRMDASGNRYCFGRSLCVIAEAEPHLGQLRHLTLRLSSQGHCCFPQVGLLKD